MSVFSIIYVLKRDFFLDIRFAERWSWIFFETSVCFLQMLQMNMYPSVLHTATHSLLINDYRLFTY